jgi:threonine dehydratase
VIAGQGTLGLEIAEQAPDAEVVVVPIGGGGLVSGIALTLAAVAPSTRVVGVEAEGAASMVASVPIVSRPSEYTTKRSLPRVIKARNLVPSRIIPLSRRHSALLSESTISL